MHYFQFVVWPDMLFAAVARFMPLLALSFMAMRPAPAEFQNADALARFSLDVANTFM